jgi:hypothetical protein
MFDGHEFVSDNALVPQLFEGEVLVCQKRAETEMGASQHAHLVLRLCDPACHSGRGVHQERSPRGEIHY